MKETKCLLLICRRKMLWIIHLKEYHKALFLDAHDYWMMNDIFSSPEMQRRNLMLIIRRRKETKSFLFFFLIVSCQILKQGFCVLVFQLIYLSSAVIALSQLSLISLCGDFSLITKTCKASLKPQGLSKHESNLNSPQLEAFSNHEQGTMTLKVVTLN